jgi:hypothetical protein
MHANLAENAERTLNTISLNIPNLEINAANHLAAH